ncbi:MAG: EFR1 family ferrodoxin [Oscillospiraceae bacterium]|nr:EFR1 family ferrodoxin [Oscillospiraceae bacterium]
MIVCFSGTGNSRYCAQLLAAQLGEELIDAFHFIRDGIRAELCSARPWIFVSPTYGWQIPRIFADFLRSSCFTGSRSAYFVMTCGSEIGNAGSALQTLCAEKGFTYQGVLEVIMPENYIAMFPVPDESESAQIIAAARPFLEAGADCIGQETPFPARKKSAVDKLKTGVVNSLFYALCVKAKAFYATDTCVGCGKCETVCPLNNIHLKVGKPIWGDRCTHCMACICGCPAEAIEYGKHSHGKPRYQCREYNGS